MTRTTYSFITTPRNWRPIALWSILVLLAIALRGALSWTSLTLLPATGDEASSVLLAKFIANGERPLLFIGQPYQFPFESYLLAPFVDWLPRNALGARSHALLLGGISVLIFVATAWKMFPEGKRWPTILLLLFPSAYWLQHQSAYTPPQYAMTAFLSAFVALLTILAWQSRKRRVLLTFLSGLFSGLLVSNNLLGLPIAAGSGFVLAFADGSRRLLPNTAVYTAGLFFGLTPYLLAKALIPEAYVEVTESVPTTRAWQVLTEYAASKTLPGTMGINPTLFTDVADLLGWPDIVRRIFLVFFLLTLSTALFARAISFFYQIQRHRSSRSRPIDLFLVTTIVTLVLFIFYERAYEHGYRFLLPVAWCFSYILGYAVYSHHGIWRRCLVIVLFAYSSTNIFASLQLVQVWSEPGKMRKISDTLPLDKVISLLEEAGTQYCYASFWHAYRITFETDEKIICSQPYNERFLFWPLPYKSLVDGQPGTPYILTDTHRAILRYRQFISHLKQENIQWDMVNLRPYYIFSNFYHDASRHVVDLLPGDFSILYGNNTSDVLGNLHDGDSSTVWSSNTPQQRGDRLRLYLHKADFVRRVTLRYNHRSINYPAKYRLTGLNKGKVVYQQDIPHVWSRLFFNNNKPIYGGLPFVVWLEDAPLLDEITIENIEPYASKTWDLVEIEVGVIHHQPLATSY